MRWDFCTSQFSHFHSISCCVLLWFSFILIFPVWCALNWVVQHNKSRHSTLARSIGGWWDFLCYFFLFSLSCCLVMMNCFGCKIFTIRSSFEIVTHPSSFTLFTVLFLCSLFSCVKNNHFWAKIICHRLAFRLLNFLTTHFVFLEDWKNLCRD